MLVETIAAPSYPSKVPWSSNATSQDGKDVTESIEMSPTPGKLKFWRTNSANSIA